MLIIGPIRGMSNNICSRGEALRENTYLGAWIALSVPILDQYVTNKVRAENLSHTIAPCYTSPTTN